MIKSQFLIKHFYKGTAVKAAIHYPDKRVRTFWAIPSDGLITVNGETYSANTNKDFFSLQKGIPLFTYAKGKIEPIRMDNQSPSIYNAEELNTVINNNVVKEIFAATDKKTDIGKILMIGMFVIVAALGIAGYLLYQELQTQELILKELWEILRTVVAE